ncbi:MAG: hypothetical protein WBA44_15525 [Mesorhizobium sp.]
MKRLMLIALVTGLAGCTTMTPAERRLADEATCRDYGFTRKNDAFAECLQRLELDRRAARRDAAREMFRDSPFPPTRVIVVRDHRPRR